jgi:serine/threonine protein kinase
LQGDTARRQAQDLSLRPTQPPTSVPGYEIERVLGVGSFGEVWVAVDRNTGRRVAIKFYTRQSGLDWSQLSREVEKLVFLSADRHVVQLLDVGWDADPPYYVMEYIQRGSLDDHIRRHGAMSPHDAAQVFREVATGLSHAHSKGVLHCDLKPGNVLLDEDGKPRIADFGQARLSHEQQASLGTMFYMAPEQADLKAVPDACWDVYALGALLYTMLTGHPPYRDDETIKTLEKSANLESRLAQYRAMIEHAPRLMEHRKVKGVDPDLVEIIDRCLAVDPNERYPNVQSVLDALDARERRRQRRPLMVLGAIGPALLLAVVGLFAWLGSESLMRQTENALTESEVSTNRFAAQYVAKAVANQIQQRIQAVERVAADPRLRRMLEKLQDDAELTKVRRQLSDPEISEQEFARLQKEYMSHEKFVEFQEYVTELINDLDQPEVASWFINDSLGLQLARAPEPKPESNTIGRNYAWRTYFSGLSEDQDPKWRPSFTAETLWATQLSAVFRSEATSRWIVAVSTFIRRNAADDDSLRNDDNEGELLGVVALTIEVGRLVELAGGTEQFAVLVDAREGPNEGLILQHPLFEQMFESYGKVPDRFQQLRLARSQFPSTPDEQRDYRDPLSEDEEGGLYNRRWIAAAEPVPIAGKDDEYGWHVIVQKSYDMAIGRTLADLRQSLIVRGLLAAALVALVLTLLWVFVLRSMSATAARPVRDATECG